MAVDALRAVYNGWSHGKAGQAPRAMAAGRELFEAYAGECLAIYRDGPTPMLTQPPRLNFKATTVTLDDSMPAWAARVTE